MIAQLAAALVLAASGAPGPGEFAFADQRIDEASALVVLSGSHGEWLSATTNDSGDTGRVFTVDAHGRTVGVTEWEQAPRDVEALAPDPDGELWVGDIGDNSETRPHIQVARIPVGVGDRTVHPTVYDLVYPDGASNAETLLCDPATGRLYVATKGWLGGTLYAAPAHLVAGRDNPLTPVGAVLPMATDGVFLPGGHEVLIRGYFSASTYAWPSMDKIASFPLPSQPQGEGVGVQPDGPGDAVYLSSEGAHSKVLRFRLPAKAVRTTGAPAKPGTFVHAPDDQGSDGRSCWPWGLGGLAGIVIIGVLIRALRPR